MFVTLAALFGLHYWLDLLDPAQGTGPTDLATFNVAHSLYLCASTAQWLAAVVYLGLAVSAWRKEDGKIVEGKEVREERGVEKKRQG